MRFAEQRETIYKGLHRLIEEQRAAGKLEDYPVPVATPRIIKDPPSLAFVPVLNRASRRVSRSVRRHKPPAYTKTWVKEDDA